MLQVENLHKSFDGVEVLKGISTTFEKGKTNLIIGQSGSGKTVFLKTLLGLINPDSGDIKYNGVDYKSMKSSQKTLLRQKMGMVFQGSALFDSMTVAENVAFPLKMFSHKTESEIKDRVEQILYRVNLKDAHNKKPSEISGGMQKRVAIARAVVNHPEFLFCDEPNSGLDPRTAIVIDNLIKEITQEFGITTIINTHDMNSVMEIGEKIVFLKNGLKQWEGSRYNIFKTENKAVTDFVYSSELLKRVRKMYLEDL